jgi:hypothetical protein
MFRLGRFAGERFPTPACPVVDAIEITTSTFVRSESSNRILPSADSPAEEDLQRVLASWGWQFPTSNIMGLQYFAWM